MKSRKPWVALLIAFIIFISFMGASRYYISRSVNLVPAVASSVPILPRTQINPENLKIIQVPVGHIPEGAARNIDTFAAAVYFTGEIGLHSGEIVTREKVFAAEDIVHAHTLTLAPGETILGVNTDLARSAGASIYPGSRVRAIAYVPSSDAQGVYEPSRAEVIFDNLRVVGVINSEAADTEGQEQRGRVPAVVQLAVTPEQETVLVWYQEEQGHKVWFTVLPENYEPDPEIMDYHDRKKAQPVVAPNPAPGRRR